MKVKFEAFSKKQSSAPETVHKLETTLGQLMKAAQVRRKEKKEISSS